MRCETCFGYFPPFDKVDQMIYDLWNSEREAAETLRRNQWKSGTTPS